MSLTTQAVVAVTHYLLEDATWAGDRILEQPIDPVGDLLSHAGEGAQPVIAVYVEKSKTTVDGRNTQGDKSELDLKVIAYITPGVTKLPDTEEWEFTLDANTAGLTLNVVARQIDAAFHVSTSVWLPIWKKFLYSIRSKEERYLLIEIENGVKIPAIEVSYHCDAIPDPDFGNPMSRAWQDLDAALRAQADSREKLADLFKSLIENPAGLPYFADFQNNHGLTDAAYAATGLGPMSGVVDDNGNVPGLEEVDVDASTIIVPEDL